MYSNPRTYLDNLYPYLLFAQQYFFSSGQTSFPRVCYACTIVLIEDGYGFLKLNGQDYEAKPGALFYIPPGKKHSWEASIETPMVHRCVYFDWQYKERPDFTHQNDYFCLDKRKLQVDQLGPDLHAELKEYSLVKDISVWVARFDQFTSSPELLDERFFPESLKIRGYFQLVLHEFVNYMSKEAEYRDPRIKSTMEMMERSVRQGLLLSERQIVHWADKAGISRSHFHALFREQTGLTPKAYWNRCLILKAKDDLKYTNLSITEIADKYGFSSIHYFSKMFRKLSGCTPSEYRNRNLIY